MTTQTTTPTPQLQALVDWKRVWFDKTTQIAAARGVEQARIADLLDMLGPLLASHRGHPAGINPEAVIACALRHDTTEAGSGTRALRFFFQDVIGKVKPYYQTNLDRIRKLLADGDPGQSATIGNTKEGAVTNSPTPTAIQTTTPGPIRQTQQHFTSREWIERLTDELKLRNYSRRTIANYSYAVTRFLDHYQGDPRQANVEDVRAVIRMWSENGNHAPGTINLRIGALTFFFTTIAGNPGAIEGIAYQKRPKSLPQVYSAEEVDRILQAPVNMKHRLLLMIAYGCGLRLGELIRLRVKDLDFDRHLLWVRRGKGAKDRRVMLDPTLQDLLISATAGQKPDTYLFCGADGIQHLSPRSAQKVLEHACDKAGVTRKGSMHTLRHSFATHMLEQGTDLRYIQSLLGHEHSTTTEIYTHVSASAITKIQSPLAELNVLKKHQSKGDGHQ